MAERQDGSPEEAAPAADPQASAQVETDAGAAGRPPAGDPPAPAPPAAVAINPGRVYAFAGLISAFVLLFGAGMFFAGWGAHVLVSSEDNSTGGQAVEAAPTPTARPAAQTTPLAVVDVSADDDPSWGPADAKVTVIEFSDFQCPYCARFHQQTLPQLKSAYGDRIRFVYRDFPLTAIHAYAEGAAEAADCANEQGRFWDYHDLLFQNQGALQVSDLKAYAGQLGLDQGKFDDCVDSHKYADEVQGDINDGNEAIVTGTPSFFINGRRLTGAQPLSAFVTLIDAALQASP